MESGPIKVIANNIDELRYRLVRVIVPILIIFSFFLFFQLRFYPIVSIQYIKAIPYPFPDPYHNMGAQLLKVIIEHTITEKYQLIAIKPTDGVVTDFYACLFLSIIVTSPNITYQVAKFVGPALKTNEKRLIKTTLIPALLLFLLGAALGVYIVAPLMFRILFEFDLGVGAQPTMSISSFVSFFFIYVLAFGLSFETPVIMIGLTYLKLVPSNYWYAHWRYAIVISLVFGLIFSPGVTGITMMLLAIPIIILYFVGVLASKHIEKKRNANPETVKEDESQEK